MPIANICGIGPYHKIQQTLQPEICPSDIVVFQAMSSYVMYESISLNAEFILLKLVQNVNSKMSYLQLVLIIVIDSLGLFPEF